MILFSSSFPFFSSVLQYYPILFYFAACENIFVLEFSSFFAVLRERQVYEYQIHLYNTLLLEIENFAVNLECDTKIFLRENFLAMNI